MSHQSRFNARYWTLGAGALGRPRGMVWGGRREEGSGWGTHVYLWWIHFDIWQNHYNIVKFKNKIKFKKINACCMTKFRDLILIFHHIYLFYLHFQDFQALFQTHIFNSLIYFQNKSFIGKYGYYLCHRHCGK